MKELFQKIKGKNGFGYDPIFIPEGKNITFGQMKPIQKYKIDHRIKAFKKIKKFFKITYFQLYKYLNYELILLFLISKIPIFPLNLFFYKIFYSSTMKSFL